MERIYSDQRIVNDRTIDSHIKKLRRKMEQVALSPKWVGNFEKVFPARKLHVEQAYPVEDFLRTRQSNQLVEITFQ